MRSLSDLRTMFCPFLPLWGSIIATVFNPLRLDTDVLAHREAGIVLRARIAQHLTCEENRTPLLSALSEHTNTWAGGMAPVLGLYIYLSTLRNR
jgi:hypothetical protein